MPKKGKKKEKATPTAKPDGEQQEETKDVNHRFSWFPIGSTLVRSLIWLDRVKIDTLWSSCTRYGVCIYCWDNAHKLKNKRCRL